MQRRFCACGNRFFVDYRALAGSMWLATIFRVGSGRFRALEFCPCCGRRLSIDSLR
ncbi:MAG: hypothetical protein PHV85_01100 [Desulfovibrionaceae bacterium]|nr:hypothetical protein [Desulfovibrionaceae bacterium]MDD4951121.1 hypothetical protein [Desulfovibrionaceae bacterium]